MVKGCSFPPIQELNWDKHIRKCALSPRADTCSGCHHMYIITCFQTEPWTWTIDQENLSFTLFFKLTVNAVFFLFLLMVLYIEAIVSCNQSITESVQYGNVWDCRVRGRHQMYKNSTNQQMLSNSFDTELTLHLCLSNCHSLVCSI